MIASDEIQSVTHKLNGDDDESEPPSPEAATCPPDCGDEKRGSQQQKPDACRAAEWNKSGMGFRIKSPHLIESRAWECKRRSSESCHSGAEEKKGGHRR